MLSAAYLIIALVDLGVLFWAAGHCLRYRSNGLLFATLPLLLLWYDNAVIAIGSTLGEGALLMNLNTVRFLAHYISLPMTFIAIGAMAREAGFRLAQKKTVMGAFCLLAVYFIGHDLWLFSQSSLYPSCFADTLRISAIPDEAPKKGAVRSCDEPMKPFTAESARRAAALPTAAP